MNSLSWLTVPPVLSIPLALLALFLQGTGDRFVYSGASLLLLGSLYLFLTALYAFSALRQSPFPRFPIQLIAQGIFVNIISQHLGTYPILAWAANAATVSGLLLLAGSLVRNSGEPPSQSFARPHDDTASTEDAISAEDIPVPFLSASEDGSVIAANERMLALLGRDSAATLGKPVTDMLPLGENEVSLQGRVFRMENRQVGNVFHFSLLEQRESGDVAGKTPAAVLDIVDQATSLYTKAYGDVRIPEEISRASRYRRWLSSILIRVEFHSLPGMSSDATWENRFMTEYCGFIKTNTRASDLPFIMPDRQIVILLPETPQQGAKDTSTKLLQLPEGLQNYVESSPTKAIIRCGLCFYNGNTPFSFDQMMQRLYASLAESD